VSTRRLRQALLLTALVYVCELLCALPSAFGIAQAVRAAPAYESESVGLLIVALRALERAVAQSGQLALVALGVGLTLTPWLRLGWLRANWRADPLDVHLRFAAARYVQALGVLLACAAYTVLALLLAAGLSLAVRYAFGFSHDVRRQTLAALAIFGTCALAGYLHATILCDAAFAELAFGATSALSALRRARSVTHARLVFARAAFALGALGLWALGLFVPRWLFGFSALGALLTLLCTQLIAMLQTGLRALWLAMLVDDVARKRIVHAAVGGMDDA
jgi:hypothetical protein